MSPGFRGRSLFFPGADVMFDPVHLSGIDDGTEMSLFIRGVSDPNTFEALAELIHKRVVNLIFD